MHRAPQTSRVIFAGTPEFASVALAELLAAGFEVPLVLTQPDRPAGRGMKLQASAVKLLALQHGIPVIQPRSLRLDGKYPEDALAAQIAIKTTAANAAVVAAYGLILPEWVLQAPTLGCFNIHASLLPRWRGAAPIHRAIEAGDAQTGITLMQMDAGLDTGDMLLTEHLSIATTDTTATLHDKLAAMGGRMAVQALTLAQANALQPVKQPEEGITYAHKIDKAEALIDWSQPAKVIECRIRAFNPFPGASTVLGTEAIKVWGVEIPKNDSTSCPPTVRYGTILQINSTGITVHTGSAPLRLTVLQRAGGKRLPVADFLRGFELHTGMVMGSPANSDE